MKQIILNLCDCHEDLLPIRTRYLYTFIYLFDFVDVRAGGFKVRNAEMLFLPQSDKHKIVHQILSLLDFFPFTEHEISIFQNNRRQRNLNLVFSLPLQ